MSLTLDLPLCATDLTACHRCADEVELQHGVRCLDGYLVCLGCVGAAVEAHRLESAAMLAYPADFQPPF